MQSANRTITIKVSKAEAQARRDREDNEPLSQVAKRIVAKKQKKPVAVIPVNKTTRVLLRTEERGYGTTSVYITAGMEKQHEAAKTALKNGGSLCHFFEDHETPCHRCGDFWENHHKNGGCKSIIPLFSCKCSSCAHCDKFAFAEMMKTPAQKKAEERAFKKADRAEARYWGY